MLFRSVVYGGYAAFDSSPPAITFVVPPAKMIVAPQRPLALDGVHGHLGLEQRRVIPAGSLAPWSSCFLGPQARVDVAEFPLIAVFRFPAPPLSLIHIEPSSKAQTTKSAMQFDRNPHEHWLSGVNLAVVIPWIRYFVGPAKPLHAA